MLTVYTQARIVVISDTVYSSGVTTRMNSPLLSQHMYNLKDFSLPPLHLLMYTP